jgi:hypothetical protein
VRTRDRTHQSLASTVIPTGILESDVLLELFTFVATRGIPGAPEPSPVLIAMNHHPRRGRKPPRTWTWLCSDDKCKVTLHSPLSPTKQNTPNRPSTICLIIVHGYVVTQYICTYHVWILWNGPCQRCCLFTRI